MPNSVATQFETHPGWYIRFGWRRREKRLLATVVSLALGVAGAQADYSLTILHTNDIHSRFEPIDQFDNDCAVDEVATSSCFGGSARLMTAITTARQSAENVVLVDAGDQFPAPSHRVEFEPSLVADLMNRMGYDAMTLGNHEFDEGPQALSNFIGNLNFPVLVANADLSSDPRLVGRTLRSVVIETGGEMLGLIGLTQAHNPNWLAYKPQITAINAVGAVQAEVDRLTGEGVNKIIVISHSGYGQDQSLARGTNGIDVIVGGHTHSYLSNRDRRAQGPYPTVENGVAVVQTYAFGNFLGKLEVTFDDEGNVLDAVGDPIQLDGSVVEDDAIKTLISETQMRPK